MEGQESPLSQSSAPMGFSKGFTKLLLLIFTALSFYDFVDLQNPACLAGSFRLALAGKKPSLTEDCLQNVNQSSKYYGLPEDVNFTYVCQNYDPPWLRHITKDGNLPTIQMIAVTNGLKTFMTFLVFGEELKFKAPSAPPDGCYSKTMHLGKCIAKAVGGFGFLALAVNAYILDVIQWFTAMQNLSDYGPLAKIPVGLFAFVEVWVLSPNLPAAMAIWSKLALQSPAAALNLTPKYEAFSGAMAFPKYPCVATWLPCLQHVYALILLPYLLLNIVFFPLILPFVMIWLVVSKSLVPSILNLGKMFFQILKLAVVPTLLIVSIGLLLLWPWFYQQVINVPETFQRAMQYEIMALYFPIKILSICLYLVAYSSMFACIYTKLIGATLDDFLEAYFRANHSRSCMQALALIPAAIELEHSERKRLAPFNVGTDFEAYDALADEAQNARAADGLSSDAQVRTAIMFKTLHSLNKVAGIQIVYSLVVEMFAVCGSLSGEEAILHTMLFSSVSGPGYLIRISQSGMRSFFQLLSTFWRIL